MRTIDPELDELMGQLGTSGKYQLKQHALHSLVALLAGLHMLSLRFVAPTPRHRCFIDGVDLNVTFQAEQPKFNTSFLTSFIPVTEDGKLDSCHKFKIPSDTSELSSCNDQYVFDTSVYAQSKVYEWNMVCGNKWQRAFIQSIYVLGVLNGALICGALADRFGRKRVLCLSAIFQFLFALASAFITNFPIYCVNLFFYGFFASGGAYVTGFVLSMELVSKKRRTYIGPVFSACFASGISINAIWGYIIRDVRTLQIVIALHTLLLFGHFWLIDESIRWLWSQGRCDEAIRIVRKACRVNNTSFENNFDINCPTFLAREKNKNGNGHSYGLADLFKKPVIRIRAMCMAFIWFFIAVCFYGLAFNTGALPGNPYLVFFFVALADLPGHLLVALTVDKTGRRPLNAFLLLIGGVGCLVTTFVPRGLVVTTIAMIVKIALAGCFAVMYNYTAEIFPTVVRNSAVGLCSMAARTGGMLTPQIILLDSLDKRIPTLVFGGVVIIASFLCLFLPETLRRELPQTLDDGENFGRGDTAFKSFLKPNHKRDNHRPDAAREIMLSA